MVLDLATMPFNAADVVLSALRGRRPMKYPRLVYSLQALLEKPGGRTQIVPVAHPGVC